MKIECPNSKKHKRFHVTVHVCQDWEIDEDGDFTKVIDECSQVVDYPDANDDFYYTCAICGTDAIATD